MRDIEENRTKLEGFFADRSELVELDVASVREGNLDREKKALFCNSIFTSYLYLAICEYSLGKNLDSVSSYVKSAFDWFVKNDQEPDNHLSLEEYYKCISLVSLCRLFNFDDEVNWDSILRRTSQLKSNDSLILRLIPGATLTDCDQTLLYPEAYGHALNGFNCLDNKDASKSINLHLKEWYKKHRSCHWYNKHKAKSFSYFGYWSFESAAILKIGNLDSANLKTKKYFPIDLVNKDIYSSDLENKSTSKVIVRYPNLDSLYFLIPENWKNESSERLSIISGDENLEIAGTVYKSQWRDLDEFSKAREASQLKNMPWYRRISVQEKLIVNALNVDKISYEGTWPGENNLTTMLSYCFDLNGFYFGLTFTLLSLDVNEKSYAIEDFLMSITYSNV